MSTITTGPEPLYSLLLHYSISEHEQNAVAFLVNWMAQAGMQSHVDAAGNAVGIRDGGPDAMGRPPRDIVLLGHIDTVPGFIPVQVRDGKLYGRGAVDAKGPLAAFAAAAAQIVLRPGWRIIVIGAVQEESAVSKGALQAVTDYRPEFVIIGEPSGWERVTLGYKGRMLMDYSYARPLSHRAGPAMGACEQAVAYWNAVAARVAEINAGRERLFDRVLLSLRQFHSEDDGFTETAKMTLGFRLPPDIGPDALAAELRRLNDGGELQFSGAEVAFQGDRNNALVRALLAGIRTEGGRPGFVLKTGTSDMNVVGPRWRCPIVAYGPGDSELDHTPEEHIEIAEWERGVRVLAHALEHVQREE